MGRERHRDTDGSGSYHARLIPGAGLVSFPGAGHYSFLDQPAKFASVLTSFLSDR